MNIRTLANRMLHTWTVLIPFPIVQHYYVCIISSSLIHVFACTDIVCLACLPFSLSSVGACKRAPKKVACSHHVMLVTFVYSYVVLAVWYMTDIDNDPLTPKIVTILSYVAKVINHCSKRKRFAGLNFRGYKSTAKVFP